MALLASIRVFLEHNVIINNQITKYRCLMIFMSAWSIKIQIEIFSKENIGASYAKMWNYLVKTPEFRDMVIGKIIIIK